MHHSRCMNEKKNDEYTLMILEGDFNDTVDIIVDVGYLRKIQDKSTGDVLSKDIKWQCSKTATLWIETAEKNKDKPCSTEHMMQERTKS